MKRLFLDFVNQVGGKRRRITIQSTKEDPTSRQVSNAMDVFISLEVVPGTQVLM
ncbi:DUF2922 family protein [Thermotoga sp. Mc24]|uniref:DUF2922 family protein n=1 Tax=Thermotoga sp. Mc24 TaxID=1231241 RepID=UPI001F303179|nr:DUF2922 family protein [Thermotoga sp. Mc24]